MNSSLTYQPVFAVEHASDVAAVRRCGQKIADELGFDETRAGQLAIVITEAATNIIKHAGSGAIALNRVLSGHSRGIDVLAYDKGPGIADLALCMHDGVSMAGTAGNGLGAMRRLADRFDVYSMPGRGSAFHMRLWQGEAPPPARHEIAALCVPLAGETECGDAWAVDCDGSHVTMLGADGLGHGPDAAAASRAAVEALVRHPGLAPGRLIEAAHAALRATRGAAVAVARLDPGSGDVRFAGIGNISACVVSGEGRRQMVSHNGIVGHNMRKVQEFAAHCPPGGLCIFHSDGLGTQWDLAQYPGLAGRSPALVAAVLMRDYMRGRDDAMVLVVRNGGGT